jgi:hypothetical protein
MRSSNKIIILNIGTGDKRLSNYYNCRCCYRKKNMYSKKTLHFMTAIISFVCVVIKDKNLKTIPGLFSKGGRKNLSGLRFR